MTVELRAPNMFGSCRDRGVKKQDANYMIKLIKHIDLDLSSVKVRNTVYM